MDAHHLRVVKHPDEAAILATRAARNARIDNRYTVDRSRWEGLPRKSWSPEAEAREQVRVLERARFTEADRIRAWRGLFALTNPQIVSRLTKIRRRIRAWRTR